MAPCRMFWQIRGSRDIIEFGKEVELNLDEFVLVEIETGLTALHMAVLGNQTDILKAQ